MAESLIAHIRRHTVLTPNDAAGVARAVAEWLDARSRERLLPSLALRAAARIIQAEVDREESATQSDTIPVLLVLCDCPFHPCEHNRG